MKKVLGFIGGMLFVVMLSGCSTMSAYTEIAQDKSNDNVQTFNVAAADLNKAVTGMLLAKKFEIVSRNDATGEITGTREVTKGNYIITVKVQANMVTKGEKEQDLYLTGKESVQKSYVQDHTRTFLWVVPVPGGGGKTVTTAKESEKTIADTKFYKDLFEAIKKNLPAEGSKA